MSKSKIEWTEATWNPVRGCSLVSPGCTNCYAMRMAHRSNRPHGAYEGLTRIGAHGPTWTGDVRFVPELLEYPLQLKNPHRIFVNSMSDLFHEQVTNQWIAAIFGVMAASPKHTFQILTKRPERFAEWFAWLRKGDLKDAIQVRTCALAAAHILRERFAPFVSPVALGKVPWPLPNVWLGVSVEDQKSADERIPLLFHAPAAVRWISAEPLLGSVQLADYLADCGDPNCTINDGSCRGLDWVVAGGESGPHARPMHSDWVRSLRDQCKAAGVPFFFKQWGAWIEVDGPRCQSIDQSPGKDFWFTNGGELIARERAVQHSVYSTSLMRRIGKRAAGHRLDGAEHQEYPA